MQIPDQISFIVLGWLFGLLGPIIVWKNIQRREANAAKRAIRKELYEFQHRMVILSFSFTLRRGKFDKEYIAWLKQHLEKYKGLNKKDGIEVFVEQLDDVTDKEIEAFVIQQREVQAGAKTIKNSRLPYLTSKIGDLGGFREADQSTLFEILEQVNLYNQSVDDARQYLSVTFSSGLSDENFEKIVSNMEDCYGDLGLRAKIISDLISKYLNL